MYLAVEKQETIYLPLLWSNTDITKAREISYVFFSFQDVEFNVQDITSITYHATLDSFNAHTYQPYTVYSNGPTFPINKKIYSDTKARLDLQNDYIESVNQFFNPDGKEKIYDHAENVSSRSITDTTSTGTDVVYQVDDSSVYFFKDHQIRKTYLSNIVNMEKLDQLYAGEDWENWRSFMHSGDHDQYQWAFRLNDDLHRDFVSQKLYRSYNLNPIIGASAYNVYESITSCHEYRDIVALSMEVIQDNKKYSIKTMNNPVSTRNVSLVGYPAPTITEIILHSLEVDWPLWLKILVIALGVILILILLRYIINFFKWLFGKKN